MKRPAEGVTVRAAHAGDAAAIDALLRAAFGGPEEARLVRELRRSGEVAVELVAEAAGELAGMIMLPAMAAPRGWLALAPLAVAPTRQRQGIGAALVDEALSAARGLGWKAVVVLGEPAYYARFGFSFEATAGMSSPYPLEFTGVLGLADEDPDPAAVLRYPPAFGGV